MTTNSAGGHVRIRRLAVGVVAAVGLLAGCGGGGRAAAPVVTGTVPVAQTEAAPSTMPALREWVGQFLPLSKQLATTFESLSAAETAQDADRMRDISAQGIAVVTQARAVVARCPDEDLAATFNGALDRDESAFNHYIAAADAFQAGDSGSFLTEMRSGTSDVQVGTALQQQATARVQELEAK